MSAEHEQCITSTTDEVADTIIRTLRDDYGFSLEQIEGGVGVWFDHPRLNPNYVRGLPESGPEIIRDYFFITLNGDSNELHYSTGILPLIQDLLPQPPKTQ